MFQQSFLQKLLFNILSLWVKNVLKFHCALYISFSKQNTLPLRFYQMKKEKKTGSIKDFKYNSFVYLKRIASSVKEVLKRRFLNNCGKQRMNEEKDKSL